MTNPLQIGKHRLSSRVLVAPMSGVTDLPFRKILQRFEPGLVVSEMVAGEFLSKGNPESIARAAGHGDIDLLVIQLVGREAKWMAEGAKLAQDAGAKIIDINMGCPARKVTSGLSGSALMKHPDHALDLIAATVNAVNVPVTLKMRLGWDDDLRNAPVERGASSMTEKPIGRPFVKRKMPLTFQLLQMGIFTRRRMQDRPYNTLAVMGLWLGAVWSVRRGTS